MRWTTVLLLIALAAAVLWMWLGQAPTRPPAPEPDPVPVVPMEPTRPPPPTTGTLVIRVKTGDGSALPAATKAGYQRPGGPLRMRAPSPDGTFRFSDAPVGELDVTAEANGYRTAKNTVTLDPGVPTETVLTLEPLPPEK